jgi:hypothetical protein
MPIQSDKLNPAVILHTSPSSHITSQGKDANVVFELPYQSSFAVIANRAGVLLESPDAIARPANMSTAKTYAIYVGSNSHMPLQKESQSTTTSRIQTPAHLLGKNPAGKQCERIIVPYVLEIRKEFIEPCPIKSLIQHLKRTTARNRGRLTIQHCLTDCHHA